MMFNSSGSLRAHSVCRASGATSGIGGPQSGDHLRDKLEKVWKATLQGTFIDQRSQDHISVLINKAEGFAPRDEPQPPEADDLEAGMFPCPINK